MPDNDEVDALRWSILQAEQTFLTHLASVDTSLGFVTTELVKEHLVPDMRKAFGKFVKDHGCTYVIIYSYTSVTHFDASKARRSA